MSYSMILAGDAGTGKTIGALSSFPNYRFIGPKESSASFRSLYKEQIVTPKPNVVTDIQGAYNKYKQFVDIYETTPVAGVIIDDWSILSENLTLQLQTSGGCNVWEALKVYNNVALNLAELIVNAPFDTIVIGHTMPTKSMVSDKGAKIEIPGTLKSPGWVVPSAVPSRLGMFLRVLSYDASESGFGMSREADGTYIVKDRYNITPAYATVPINFRELLIKAGKTVPLGEQFTWLDDYLGKGIEFLLAGSGSMTTVSKHLMAIHGDKHPSIYRFAEQHLIDRVLITQAYKKSNAMIAQRRAKIIKLEADQF